MSARKHHYERPVGGVQNLEVLSLESRPPTLLHGYSPYTPTTRSISLLCSSTRLRNNYLTEGRPLRRQNRLRVRGGVLTLA
jgi:hypothetical protein